MNVNIPSHKKVHSKNYVNYKLNGDSNVKINYGSDFEDSYVLSEVNNKVSKDVSINDLFQFSHLLNRHELIKSSCNLVENLPDEKLKFIYKLLKEL